MTIYRFPLRPWNDILLGHLFGLDAGRWRMDVKETKFISAVTAGTNHFGLPATWSTMSGFTPDKNSSVTFVTKSTPSKKLAGNI